MDLSDIFDRLRADLKQQFGEEEKLDPTPEENLAEIRRVAAGQSEAPEQ